MGAISHNARSTVRLKRTLPSQPLRRVFCCPKHGSSELPGASRNGRPGSRGSRGNARAQARGACRREQGDEPDTDGRVNSKEFANGGASTAPRRNFQNGLPHRSGSTNAGGEDIGYFAPPERAGSNPAFDARTGDAASQRSARAPAQLLARKARRCVVVTDTDIARSPAYLINGRRRYAGQAVVKMSVTSVDAPSRSRGSESRVRVPPAAMPWQSMLLGAATASTVPRQPSPRPVVKIAVTSSVKREVAGSNPARRHVRR